MQSSFKIRSTKNQEVIRQSISNMVAGFSKTDLRS